MISEKTRNDFPLLRDGSFTYLDTAATSQTPDVVIGAVEKYYTEYRANIHRGLYAAAEKASLAYEEARASVARMIDADPSEIIFTAGATASSNMLIYSLEQTIDLQEGDEIAVSITEHHSSLVPLQELARRKGLVIRYIPITDDYRLDYAVAEECITEKTKIVSVMLASNVLGTVHDVAFITKLARKVGAVMISDATAAVGHTPVRVKDLDVDFLYFSGHKMCGPTGIGVLYGKKEKLASLRPGFFGGGMIDQVTLENEPTWAEDVSRFEAGTPNIGGAIGLGAAVSYLEEIGIENIHKEVVSLNRYAFLKLGKIAGVRLVCEKDPERNVGIISFEIEGIHSHDVAEILGGNNVAIRAGHHCAMPLMKALGVSSTSRASMYFYTSEKDVDALCEAIEKAKKIFNV